MGWQLRISHVTQVRYSGPVFSSFNEARMTPLTLPGQTVTQTGVSIGHGNGTASVPAWNYDDYWGTRVTVFELPEAHDDLVIRATATVETSPPAPMAPGRSLGWEQIREAAARGRLLEYVLATPLTTLPPEAGSTGVPAAGRMTPDDAAAAVCARVRERVRYMPGATGVRTSAREAWDKGEGVCQDIAHVTVSLLRAAGLPARYVSGYLHPKADPEPGGSATGQSHAWVEYWAGTWTPLDPTSGTAVAQRHVVVARGRDYADVPPLKGIYYGAPDSLMKVSVEVTRLA